MLMYEKTCDPYIHIMLKMAQTRFSKGPLIKKGGSMAPSRLNTDHMHILIYHMTLRQGVI